MHAFVDESERPGRYLMCGVVVASRDLATVRRSLTALRLSGQRRLHLNHESPPRRRMILDRVAGLPLRALMAVVPGSAPRARRQCLRDLATRLADAEVTRVVIEPVDGMTMLDQSVLYAAVRDSGLRTDLTYEHVLAHHEPILWAADAVAWGYGAGGDWRRRIAPVLDEANVPRQRKARTPTVR